MSPEMRRKQSFLLRLPVSVRDTATQIAHEEGTSLNHFISLAVAEKLTRMKAEEQKPQTSRSGQMNVQRPSLFQM